MSYSFTVKGPTKEAVKALVAAQFDQVVQAQACHLRDKDQALATAGAFVDLVDDDFGGRALQVHINGSLTGIWQGSDVIKTTGAAFSVSAGLVG